MRNISPIGWNSVKTGLWHRWIGFDRAIFFKSRAGQIETLVARGFDAQGIGKDCHICGYELAKISLENGWTFQACPATVMRGALAAQGWQKWCQLLALTGLDHQARETHLQTSGH